MKGVEAVQKGDIFDFSLFLFTLFNTALSAAP
jgi:hypothetical protein